MDQCLFVNKKRKIFCLVYIDDVIWVAPDQMQIEKVIESLKDELEMAVEGYIMAFLGINLKHLLTEFRQPLQVQSHLEMPRILVQLGHTQRT